MTRRIFVWLLVLICLVPALGVSPAETTNVLIIQDELPQMQVLAEFLRQEGKLSVTITDQPSSP
ncbi:MAG: hypothetical protein ACYS0H_27350, partial [Planctomycetota bacterium]